TRTCNNLFGPGRDKECFWIFDLCQNLEFFLGQGGAESTSAPESLSTRLFRSRLALIEVIDQQLPASDSENPLRLHRHTLAELLRCHVAACPADNFLVRPHLELLECFSRPEAWSQLSLDDHQALATTLAPLPSAYAEQQGDTDADARRFDLLLYNLQLALLRGEPRFLRLQLQLRELAAQMEARPNIPQVAAELELIRDLLCDEWWQDVTVPMLEEVRRRLRSLMGLIETTGREPLYTNFADELGELLERDAAALLSRDEFQQFRLRARDFLRAHDDHLTMQRLRRNQPLTPADLNELEQFLISHGIGDQQTIVRAREECNGFGLFIRSLVGLDRNAAKELFADYLAEGTHTAIQIR
ncbi:MAG: type I restriction-modification enzyme R subunit C-terminal domain-containing protein, partial [Cyanobium sp.]